MLSALLPLLYPDNLSMPDRALIPMTTHTWTSQLQRLASAPFSEIHWQYRKAPALTRCRVRRERPGGERFPIALSVDRDCLQEHRPRSYRQACPEQMRRASA